MPVGEFDEGVVGSGVKLVSAAVLGTCFYNKFIFWHIV